VPIVALEDVSRLNGEPLGRGPHGAVVSALIGAWGLMGVLLELDLVPVLLCQLGRDLDLGERGFERLCRVARIPHGDLNHVVHLGPDRPDRNELHGRAAFHAQVFAFMDLSSACVLWRLCCSTSFELCHQTDPPILALPRVYLQMSPKNPQYFGLHFQLLTSAGTAIPAFMARSTATTRSK